MKRVITASSSDNSYNYKGYSIKDMGSYFDVCDGPKILYTAETSKDAEKFVDGLDVKSCTNVRSFIAVPGKGIQATKVQAADEPWPPTITYNEYEEGDQPVECYLAALDNLGLDSEPSGQGSKGWYYLMTSEGDTVTIVDMDDADRKINEIYEKSRSRQSCIVDMQNWVKKLIKDYKGDGAEVSVDFSTEDTVNADNVSSMSLLKDFYKSSGMDFSPYSYRLYSETEDGERLDDVTFTAPGDYFALFGTYLHKYTDNITLEVIAKDYENDVEDLQSILNQCPNVEEMSDYANSQWNEEGDFVIAIDNLDTGARILDNTNVALSWGR